MALGTLFGFSDRLWETLTLLFVFIPAALLWALTLFHIFRLADLTRWWKIVWCVAVVLFPLVGTIVYWTIYWVRRPTVVITEQPAASMTTNIADAVDSVSLVLDNFAVTMTLAQTSLAQGAGMLHDVADTLEKTGDTIGFTVPLTGIRPFRSAYADVDRFTRRSRSLSVTLARTASALGANAADLRYASSQVKNVSRSVRQNASRIPLLRGAAVNAGEPIVLPGSQDKTNQTRSSEQT